MFTLKELKVGDTIRFRSGMEMTVEHINPFSDFITCKDDSGMSHRFTSVQLEDQLKFNLYAIPPAFGHKSTVDCVAIGEVSLIGG